MLWDELTKEEKRACYDSYVQEIKDEYGDKADFISFEDYDKDWTGFIYDIL